ncbi:unnamed protein product [Adineta steineri]|uniref:Uncharacterized protein n=1 Tax=Adineta steineri TaxID=433720 RepID=A0A814IPE9_9BILA|nr:unnamed protein product [Adineta steineri]CAF1064437.1 unnamed protein product [Adineta steineri]
MIVLCFIQIIHLLLIGTDTYEIDRKDSNKFLNTKISFRSKYEQSRETIETTRELCLDEYRQQQKFSQRRQVLSPFCSQYCAETMDCQQQNEQSACVNPLYPPWPLRTLKFVQKFERVCYIRITEVLRYEQAEQLCRKHGLELAIIDNMRLLERLKQMNMFNTTCKGQCPETRGFYIGLKRQMDEDSLSSSKWIWSNNVTWAQSETDCGDEYSETSFANASLLCYIGSDGQKKVTVWNEGEPNNHRVNQFQLGEQCVEIIARPRKNGSSEDIGRLNDIPCVKATLGAICQINDLKPINSTRFEYFATIMGFNETETEENDLLKNLFSNFEGSIEPNLDAMASMTAALEGLLALPSFTTEQANHVLNIVDHLVNITGQIEVEDNSLKVVTNKLLHFIDLFPVKIEINNEQSTSFKYENMMTSLVNVNFAQQDDSKWFTIKSDKHHPDSIIELNIRALRELTNNYCIIETIFSNFNLFLQTNKTTQINNNRLLGTPISYQIANWTTIKIDEDFVRFQIRVPKDIQTRNISCVYWSFDKNNGSWIEDNGCHFAGYKNDYAQCYCNHLTHFALLMLPESEQTLEPLSYVESFILTTVTYIGIGLSIFGLVITLITYILFRCLQKNHLHSSLFMLCLSILFVNCLYIPFSLIKPHELATKKISYCNILGFLFHYFITTSFMWMLIMASIQYMYFVRIFNTHISHFLIKVNVIGWILPLIFPILVISIGTNGGYTGETRCWINNEILLYTTFLAPISLIVFCNFILFLFILQSLFQSDPTIPTQQNNRSKLQVGAALCCFVSIGCTWAFGILVLIRSSFIHQLIFCISNSLQGFLIFIFHVYLSKPKRELWQTFFIQRGFHQRPHSISAHTALSTTSDSGTRNISSLARPVKFRFTSTQSTNDSTGASTAINPTFTDTNGSNLLNKERIQPGRTSQIVIRSQPEFLYDKIQKAKMEINNHYA